MKIYFGQQYTPNAYIDFKSRGGILFDGEVVGIDGLVRLLELRLGLHYDEVSVSDRQASYFKAMSQVMDEEENILSASWATDSLGVSNACLKWRDALVMTGWTPDMKQPSARLDLLAKAEAFFHIPSTGDRLMKLLAICHDHNPLPDESEILVAANSYQDLMPTVAELLKELERKGVKVVFEQAVAKAPEGTNLHQVQSLLLDSEGERKKEIHWEPEDDSFEILHVSTEFDAMREAMCADRHYDVFVCRNHKLLDNTKRQENIPTSGSSMVNAEPQIVQLFKLGLSLFEYPLNIRNIISWLLLPLHPLSAKLRYSLVKTILKTGGVHNDDCQKVITEYLDGIDDKKKRERKQRDISVLIPEPCHDGTDKKELLIFVHAIESWCGEILNTESLKSLKPLTTLQQEQLHKVSELYHSIATLLEHESSEVIMPLQLKNWAKALSSPSDYTLYENQANGSWVVSNGDIVDEMGRCMWTDCYNHTPLPQPTHFLNEEETNSLTEQGCRIWRADNYNRSMLKAELRPILMAKKRVQLIITDQCNGEMTQKHPLIQLLLLSLDEKWENTGIVFDFRGKGKYETMKKTKGRDDTDDSADLHLKNSTLLTMPEKESYSSLENLIQYPLDYTLDRILHFYDRSSTELDNVKTVKGNVAHAVIEQLFRGTNEEIEVRLATQYEETLNKMIEQRGAILLLQENVIERRMFREELKNNLQSLLTIIKENHLKVVYLEHAISGHIGLMDSDDPIVNGFIDMVLENKRGEWIVFDFKWTSSKNWHERLLGQNVSIQLALYKEVLELSGKKKVAATAYFTMPRHQLYTQSDCLTGKDVKRVECTGDTSPLIDKIISSYRYRREQIENGIIENGEGREIAELVYGQDTEDKNLVPLSPDYNDGEIHGENSFSNYQCFKGNLQ